jgi:acetoin utilization deacetylase AcuC-like enzyme
VALGLDTHQADPIGGFALTTEFFRTIAKRIADLNLPTVIVQEGGYNTHLLGANAASFLAGFQ